MKRVLTALALIPIVGWVVLAADPRIFLAVLVIVSCLCYREYNDIAAGYGFGAPGIVGYGAGLLLLTWWDVHWLSIVGLAVVVLIMVMRDQELEHALPRAALLVTGVIYVFGCWKCARPLRDINPHWLMYGLALNWVGDIGAYYVGRPFGKHKLAPRVSPKKSWEGSIASVIVSGALGTLYLQRFLPEVPLAQAIGLTVVANIAGQLGDLAESAMKRGADVKDSGVILPGHGGFLDRVDSTLFALPVIYGFLLLVR
ncbi:MAG: phosphatidate cytidylyltransferase [Candidatus Solibacter sp.]|jgi:phosphatidate cytidylyltransferase|nr:phosphatidate cytidylyltransferase [Candidatus Solibacter sp.]